MLCVSWCDPANRRDKAVRKVFEMNLGSTLLLQWTEASAHPDAPMDSNSVRRRPGQDQLVEMFRIFGKILDFATACRVSGSEQSWSCIARENMAAMADAMSCRLKSLAVLLL
ncbi:hypothetical protein CFC21_057582 [Triticum aestivum]|uniref:Uncharacterized protein n=2 Tax=Triticum aestivum TaxID=4565 RepID=A0A3B6ISE6_WHEAT|nr:hypothetical protein CFC21_057582 [Triticum aestivum]